MGESHARVKQIGTIVLTAKGEIWCINLYMTDQDGEKFVSDVVQILKEHRVSCSLSQRALALKAGINPKTVSLLERNDRSPTLFTLARIASAMGLNLSDILKEAETTPLSK